MKQINGGNRLQIPKSFDSKVWVICIILHLLNVLFRKGPLWTIRCPEIKEMSSLILLSHKVRGKEERKYEWYTCIYERRTAKSEIMSYSRWGQWQAIWSRKSPCGVSQPLRQPRSIWKSNALSLLTSQVLECESLGQVKEQDRKWWMSHLNDTLQSLHHVLAEESQENKWLSFTF